ncbi:MAG: hypothetical protein WBE72_21785 [Terracidiphilus sp.]
MTGVAVALIATSMPRNIDPREGLRYFSWLNFAFIALVYSVLIFVGKISKDGPRIFSRRNARQVLQILVLHSSFIIILLLLVRISNQLVPILPYWMTDTFNAGRGARLSIADLMFVAIAAVLAFIERIWIYLESAPQ